MTDETPLTQLERHVIETGLQWRKAKLNYSADEPLKEQSHMLALGELERKRGEKRPQSAGG